MRRAWHSRLRQRRHASIHDILIDGNEVRNSKLGWSKSMVFNGNVRSSSVSNNLVHDNDNIGIDLIGYRRHGPDPAVDRARNGTVIGNLVYNINSYGNPAYDGGSKRRWNLRGWRHEYLIERNIIHDTNIGIELASEHKNRDTSYITSATISSTATGSRHCHRRLRYETRQHPDCTIVNNTLYNNATQGDWGAELYIQYDTRTTPSRTISLSPTLRGSSSKAGAR